MQQISHSIRILFKYRAYTLISMAGLSIAISSFWFISNFVKHANQHDTFHNNYQRIYRVTTEITAGGNTDHYATTGTPLGKVLYENYSGIQSYARMTFYDPVVQFHGEVFQETGFFDVNQEALDVFSFEFLKGDQKTCFSEPNVLLLSRSLAEKYFNRLDIIGQSVSIDDQTYIIQGVFENLPHHSHLNIHALSFSGKNSKVYQAQDWFDLEQYSYILLDSVHEPNDLNDKLKLLNTQYLDPILAESGIEVQFHSQPLEEIYYSTGFISDVPKGNKTYVHAMTFSSLLLLFIAGLNYLNLSLTRSTQRSKEFSLKKILGISRWQLLFQTTIESCMMSLLILLTSAILILLLDNLYHDYTGFQSIQTGNWLVVMNIFLFIFCLGVIGSSYTTTYLSFSRKLIEKESVTVSTLKKILLGIQVTITSIILIVTLTMGEQIDYMKNKELGFSKDQVLILKLPENKGLKRKKTQFKEHIKTFATIKNASVISSGALPGEENGKELFGVNIDGNRTEKVYDIYGIDESFLELLDIQLSAGRNFQPDGFNDSNESIMINESLAKSLNWADPLGKKIWVYNQPRKVIGVVKDFHHQSFHHLIEPIVFLFDQNYSKNLLIKAKPSEVHLLESEWKKHFPNTPFTVRYFDQFIDQMYQKEDQLTQLLNFFSLVCLSLCCMGIFSIFSLHILQKMAEISIRKVLGASGLSLLLSGIKSYALVLFLSIVNAIPIAWMVLNQWLAGFSYQIQMSPINFILSIGLVLCMSLIAMGYHIRQILIVNPVDMLNQE